MFVGYFVELGAVERGPVLVLLLSLEHSPSQLVLLEHHFPALRFGLGLLPRGLGSVLCAFEAESSNSSISPFKNITNF